MRRIVVTKEDLPRCKPLNLRNLYNLSSKNCLGPAQKAQTACVRAVFLRHVEESFDTFEETSDFLNTIDNFTKDVSTFENLSKTFNNST